MTQLFKQMEHAAAWAGDELKQCPEWNYSFTGGEIDELLSVARQAPPVAYDRPLEEDLPPPALPQLAEKLRDIQLRLEQGTGAIRWTGFPADDVGEPIAKLAFWYLCRHLGTPVSQSAAGLRLFDVRDTGFAENDKRARGPNTRKKLSIAPLLGEAIKRIHRNESVSRLFQ